MRKFIEKVMAAGEFEGCWYNRFKDSDLYLVFAWCEIEGELPSLCGKIAYNCDDLQCDYDFDWFMPMVDDEVIDTEITDCQNLLVDAIYDSFMEQFEDLN